MANLPYVTAPGNVTKALNAIISAATPEKVTQDFVKEMLKIPGGSGATGFEGLRRSIEFRWSRARRVCGTQTGC